jgi:hypothetical protein
MTRCTQADCVKDAEEWWRVNQHLVAGNTEPTPDALKNTEGGDSSVSPRSSRVRSKGVIRAAGDPAECMTVQEAATSRFPVDMERSWDRRTAHTDSKHSQDFCSITKVVLMTVALLVGFRVLELGLTHKGDAARAAVADVAGSMARYSVAEAGNAISKIIDAAPETAAMKNAAIETATSSLSTAAAMVPTGVCLAAEAASEAGSWTIGVTAETVLVAVTWVWSLAMMVTGGRCGRWEM